MFHLELRQFPTSTRVFNLTAAELRGRFVAPWVAGETIEHDEHRFSPEKAKLKIYEGPELRPDEIGMGRGWGNVTRSGEDVTSRILDEAQRQSAPTLREEAVRALSGRLIARAAGGPVGFGDAMALAADGQPGWRASDRLAVAELAVWELLHTGGLSLVRDGAPVPKPEWEAIVLAWDTWREEPGPGAPMLGPGAPPLGRG